MKFLVSLFFTCVCLVANEAKVDAQQLYKKCVGCHGKDAKHAPYERPAGILHGRTQEELKLIMLMIRSGEYKNDKINKIMTKSIKNFSDTDIDAVSEYISKL